jgi:hypothetical protein
MKKAYMLGMAAVLLLTLSMGSQVSADTVTEYFTFSASDLTPAAPTVTGSFTITFDPSQTYLGVLVDSMSINISVAGDTRLDYASAYPGSMMIYGSLNDRTVIRGTDDFWLGVGGLSTTPSFYYFAYAQAADPASIHIAGTITGSVTTVPLPPTLLLVGTGLIPLAWARRKKRLGK